MKGSGWEMLLSWEEGWENKRKETKDERDKQSGDNIVGKEGEGRGKKKKKEERKDSCF